MPFGRKNQNRVRDCVVVFIFHCRYSVIFAVAVTVIGKRSIFPAVWV
jgi:hypothetical protein